MPWRFVARGSRSVSGPKPASLSRRAAERGQPLPDSSRIPGRPRAAGRSDVVPAVPPAGRGARAVGGPRHRGPEPRRDRTRHARSSRTDPASGSALHATSGRPSNARHAAAASNRSNSWSLPTRSTRRRGWPPFSPTIAGRCCTNSLATCIRCLPFARHSLGASTRSASCSIRRRRGSVACVRRFASHTTGCGGASTRSWARSSATRFRSRSSRSATADTSCPVKAEARSPGEGHRPRRVGQRSDAVHRATRRRRARQRLARGPGRRGRGDRPDPRRAVRVRGRQRDCPPRDARRACPVRPVGGEGVTRRRHGRHPRRDRRPTRGRPAVGTPPRPRRPRRPDRHPTR